MKYVKRTIKEKEIITKKKVIIKKAVMIGCGFVGSASVGKEALKFKKSADALKKVIETIGF